MTRALVILLVCATPAFAQKMDDARQHFKAGKTLQDAGKFAEAADEYQAAYDLDPRPAMLFNIAQAHRLAGHKQLAVDFYKRYLQAQPDGAGAREARQWTAELTRQLEAERPVTPPPTRPDPPPITPPATPTLAPPSQQPEHPPQAPSSGRRLRLAGIAAGVAGLAAVGAGVAFAFKARSAQDTIDGHTMGPWTGAEMDAFYAGQRDNRYMIASYAAGGALIATGAVLFVLGSRKHVMPLAPPRGGGLAVGGRF